MGRAGALHDAVAFDEPTGAADAFGGVSVAWTERHACRAEIRFQSGDEAVQAARVAGRRVFKVRLRSCIAARAISESWRMRDTRRSAAYDIKSVDSITDRAWVWLMVEGPVV